jgi:hypothetical protein
VILDDNFLISTRVLVFNIFAGENNLIEEQSEIVNLDPGLREGEAAVGLAKKIAFLFVEKILFLRKCTIELGGKKNFSPR